MTVGELKKKLEQYDENLPAYVNCNSEWGTDEAEYVEKEDIGVVEKEDGVVIRTQQ